MPLAIEIKGLSHQYENTDFQALNNVNLAIEKGTIFGLLGPNGAGKTTLISILTGLIKPGQGKANILGCSFEDQRKEIQLNIGVVPQEYALYTKLTAVENLMFFGSMYGVERKLLKERIATGIEKLGLTKFAHKRIDTFSGGMKRRINLLAGVLHQPKLIFLDEPTVGVDVHSKQFIMSYLNELNANGATIVYSSHLLHEAQNFCTRVSIIANGEIKVEGETKEILMKDGELKSLEQIFIETTRNH